MNQTRRPLAADAIASLADSENRRERSPRRDGRAVYDGADQPSLPPLLDILSLLRKQQEQNAAMLQSQMQQNAMIADAMTKLLSQEHTQQHNPAPATPVPAQQLPAPKLTHIPAAISKEIDKRARDFSADVLSYARSQSTLQKAQDDLNVFETTTGYPKRSRIFKSPVSFLELDDPFPDSVDTDYAFTIPVPQGSSMREALAQIHHSAAKFAKQIDVVALKRAADNKRDQASKASLMSVVTDIVSKAGEEDYATTLGLPKPLDAAIDDSALIAKVEATYSKIYKTINEKLKAEHEKAAKAREDAEKPASVPEPDQLFDNAVTSAIDSRLATLGLGDAAMVEQPPNDKPAQKFIDSLAQPKNGQSPSEGAGHNAHASLQAYPPRTNVRKWRAWHHTDVPDPKSPPGQRPQRKQGRQQPWWKGIHQHAVNAQSRKFEFQSYGNGGKSGGSKGKGKGKGKRQQY